MAYAQTQHFGHLQATTPACQPLRPAVSVPIDLATLSAPRGIDGISVASQPQNLN